MLEKLLKILGLKKEDTTIKDLDLILSSMDNVFCSVCHKTKDKRLVRYRNPSTNEPMCDACYMKMYRQIKNERYD